MSPIFYVNGSLTSPGTLTITANDAFRSQGAPNRRLRWAITGSEMATPLPGTQRARYHPATALQFRLLRDHTSGATAPNYSINYVDGTLSVGSSSCLDRPGGDRLRTVPEAPTMSISNPSLPPMEWPSEAPVNPIIWLTSPPPLAWLITTPGQIPSGDWMVDSEIDNQYDHIRRDFSRLR